MTLYEEVRVALRESQFRPRKRLGQNFLIHERVIDSILRLLDLRSDDDVLEIGPGLGFLTRRLVELANRVYAVEVDDLSGDDRRPVRQQEDHGLADFLGIAGSADAID